MQTTKFKSLFPPVLRTSNLSDSFLDSIFGDNQEGFPENLSSFRKYKILEEEDCWKIQIPFPGASKEDVKISLKDGDKLIVEVTGGNEWSKGEIRKFKLLPSADGDSINAEMENGLLTLKVSIKKSLLEKTIQVK